MILYTFLLSCIPVVLATYTDQSAIAGCKSCDAYGTSRRPNSDFTHRDGCLEYTCQCKCSGAWECPAERTKDICKSDNPCSTCWAGNEVRQPNRPFQFTEDCYRYDCFCACDGGWNCPKEKTIDICNTNLTTGCYYCTVGGVRHQGNSHFRHVNGCIEYDCVCNCDGGWNCPAENAVDRCNTNPDTGCYYCEVGGKRYDGNSYFSYTNGCIEYNCVCNCDGSWNCPGEKARDLCRQNLTTGCYYCEVDGYLFQGNSKFDLVRDCYKYPGCNCACDGGWTCAHTIGNYVCDITGREISECESCVVANRKYRGNSMFSLDRDCVKYICTCDCRGNYYCPAENARVTCSDVDVGHLASLSSGVLERHDHTREPRQVSVDTTCSRCSVSGGQEYQAGDRFSRVIGCNRFECTCYCNGTYICPAERTVNICGTGTSSSGSRRGSGGSGLDATGSGSRQITAISRGSAVDIGRDSSVSVCRNCEYLGVTYNGNSPFTFEKGCFKYNCQCYCNGSFSCPSERSQYICEGREQCVRCDLTDYDAGYKEPNTNFQIRRGCDLFEKCRCNCDGGWNCEDGVYACELETGCTVDGRRYAPDTKFELTKGCDRYKDCYCYPDGRWSCEGKNIEDLCGQCRKCKIGDKYYDGDTTFQADVNCTRYRSCTCKCNGSYECRVGRNICDVRGDQPPECPGCVIDGRRYVNGQSFDYTSGCVKGRACECRCGAISCREVDDTCGDCRSCNVDGVDYAGGSNFAYKQGCYEYSRCTCNCNGRWECFGDSAKDVCNKCRKCNVDGTLYEPYTKFNLDRNCWNYQCFCLCNGTTWCPSATVVNTCQQPERCHKCVVDGRDIQGNSHFNYKLHGMDMHCRCNCDSSYVCIAEWLYIREDVSISGTGIGTGLETCFSCAMDGRTYKGDTSFSISRSGINMKCECYCNGGYFCYGEKSFDYTGCRACAVYGKQFEGTTTFSLVYNGLKLSCQCSCDSNYVCYGSQSEVVISCIGGSGCLPTLCSQCIVDGIRFNGFDQFGTVHRGQNLRCDCGCDGSYYCEGSGGIIISCARGQCKELGCGSCDVYGTKFEGGSPFEAYYRGLKLACQCECGGNYQCFGANQELIVTCLDGNGCLTGACASCVVDNRQYNGLSIFNYNYNGIAMRCVCACDRSYYCEGVYEQIQISCIGGQCTRLGCSSCNVFGIAYQGDSEFEIISLGLKMKCQCSCDSGYTCTGGSSTITCLGGRGSGCLPSTCRACVVNNREYAGRSTYRSVYKGIDVMCTCGCDGSSYCVGISISIEVSCIGNTCTRIGCKECSIFGREYIGGSTLDIILGGLRASCTCDCDGGYICTGSNGVRIVVCVNGFGPGCLLQTCNQCVADNRRYDGGSSFTTMFQGIEMSCTCSCDSSYYCKGVREEIEISCVGGKCTPLGCRSCSAFGTEYDGASVFNTVYAGLLLNCTCSCDGVYSCRGEGGAIIFQCRDGRGTCFNQQCRPCEMLEQTFTSLSTYRYNYQGVDVSCTCGCDGSAYCVGIFTKIIISCIGGKCSPFGCQNCIYYGEKYPPLSSFSVVSTGYRSNCKCECSGDLLCEGGPTPIDCRGDRRQVCEQNRCKTCTLDGRVYNGRSTFKYVYKGIDVSCECGCDSSIFCIGVTELIEIHCVAGICKPEGCRDCRVLGRDIKALSDFDIIHGGARVKCTCGCDSRYTCKGSTNTTVFECLPGRSCLPDPCRECVVDGRRHAAGSRFAHRYKHINMNCECGCDGTAYCEGIEEIIYVSCIGSSCSRTDCDTCSIFGDEFAAETNFDIVYKGLKMNCDCNCNSSYTCRGGGEIVDCRRGQNCLPGPCRKCRVNGDRYDGGATFQMDYQGIKMNCQCGCDGTHYCVGVSVDIIISCQRRGGCRQIGGCRSCSIYSQNYPGGSKTDFVYQGYFMNCQCQCDSSYKCLGRKGEIIIECSAGRDCLTGKCGTCLVDGREFAGTTQFDHVYNGKNMGCTCGCDGSYYCRCKDDNSEISCNRRGSCTWVGCSTCLSDSRPREAYEQFEKVYDGIRTNCQCACDGSYRCQGVDRSIVIICRGDACSVQGCRSCLVDGREYQKDSAWEVRQGSQIQRCTCRCDGTTECTTVTQPSCVNCLIDGVSYNGHSRNRVYRGSTSYICDCYCNGTHNCYPERQLCGRCNIGGEWFQGNTNFETILENTKVQCTCDCSGNFTCWGGGRTCTTASGCVVTCPQCVIDGQRFQGDSTFDANVFGLRMKCTCDCAGGYTCRSDTRTCTSASGCVDNCRQCVIDGQRFQGDSTFDANVFSLRMKCTCDCLGGYTCRSDTSTCTSTSGCVETCSPCVIDNQRFQRSSQFQADVFGTRMTCSCDCSGSYTCRSDTKTCSSSTGCVDTCQECIVNGRRNAGNSVFEAVLEGIRMRCTCDCRGNYECKGDSYTCTTRYGCISSCPGCEIEGRKYAGNTKFEIFHNAYGIRMTCDCECEGTYRCNGTRQVENCVGSGCTNSGGCNNCVINGITYKGNTQFEAIIDGNRMQCSCSCSGGYHCEGTRTDTSCYGPGCALSDGTCSNCVIRGNTFEGNTQFEIDGDDGVRMQCTCDCDGKYSCRGEKTTTVCVGTGCTGSEGGVQRNRCNNCMYEGREYRGDSTFTTTRDGIRMNCTCSCTGEVRCEGTRIIDNKGSTGVSGCRRCVIDGTPYSGNTRFTFRKGNLDYACVCYCDGSHNCKGSSGLDTSCVGANCAADQCRSCTLFDREYQMDARFRLQKNDLIMNCVCECDGAYRCWSVSGTCTGSGCDDYGCKSCAAEGNIFPANSQFELSTGLICTCQCNGEYKCRVKSLGVECVGADCGVGDGCRKCVIDGDIYPGNRRFQIRKYGLLMQCACNCDSTYTCRGYQIISEGQSDVDTGCKSCVIDGRRYNGGTRFQTIINGERHVCSCDCDGRHSCSDEDTECRDCLIGNTRYASNRDFVLSRHGNSIRCNCDCSGNFVCEGRKQCLGNDCITDGCKQCEIFGINYRGGSKFTTDAGGITMLCECLCTGEYSCKGYRRVTNVILPAKEEKTCQTCFVADTERPGNSKFTIQRGCFQIECFCGCEGLWECPEQIPKYVCEGNGGLDSRLRPVVQQRYSIAGSHVYTSGGSDLDSKQSTLIYTGEETRSTVFGSDVCRSCYINEQEYAGNTEFVLQDGCLRWTCACDCSGGYNCSAVVGSECDGPLAPFEPKQCQECNAYGRSYPPNQAFTANDECYRYSCQCECDGSWECPRELTVNTCVDSSDIYDPSRGTCRQCVIGTKYYNYGETFDLVDDCLNYKCQCRCNGSYFCPASTAVRVCRSGSGTSGRPVTTGSNTIAQTGRTVVALRPAGYGNGESYSRLSDGSYTTYTGGSGSYQHSESRTFSDSGSSFSGGEPASYSTPPRGHDGRFYRIQDGTETQDASEIAAGEASRSLSHTSGSGSFSSGSEGQVDLLSLFSGSQCRDCIVDGKSLKGGRDFTFRSGCIEHLCECFCNGTSYCDPEKQVNFCEEDRARASNVEPQGCTVGNRTYKTKLFSYEKDCKKYYCRCYDTGFYRCYDNKTKTVC